MITTEELEKVKAIVEEFLVKITASDAVVNLIAQAAETTRPHEKEHTITDVVFISVTLPDPQLFIGQNGQTLLEMDRLLRMVLCRKLQKNFYISLDINEYKKKKIEHLKKLANDTAQEAVMDNEKKVLSPMSSYERRIIHDELAKNIEVVTESEGEGSGRRVIIKPARNL